MPDWAQRRLVITIITPTYNRLSSLQEFLHSVATEMGNSPVEVIVVDDASSDGSWYWLQTTECLSNVRVRSVRLGENSGPGHARNVGLEMAEGGYFCPLDSDMIVMPGAQSTLEDAINNEPDVPLFLFPCVEYPAMRRLDSLKGNRLISRDDLLYERVRGELIPVAKVAYFRDRGLRYPEFRSGGEGILWIRALTDCSALFVDKPIAYYRTDVPDRICTARHQLRRSAELAEIADAMLGLFPVPLPPDARSAKARRMMASGIYHLLAGHSKLARERLRGALALGNCTAFVLLAASVLGVHVCRAAFRVLRTEPTGPRSLGPVRGIPEC